MLLEWPVILNMIVVPSPQSYLPAVPLGGGGGRHALVGGRGGLVDGGGAPLLGAHGPALGAAQVGASLVGGGEVGHGPRSLVLPRQG